MDMTCTKGVAEVNECWVYNLMFLTLFQQVLKIAQVAETSSHSISEHLVLKQSEKLFKAIRYNLYLAQYSSRTKTWPGVNQP